LGICNLHHGSCHEPQFFVQEDGTDLKILFKLSFSTNDIQYLLLLNLYLPLVQFDSYLNLRPLFLAKIFLMKRLIATLLVLLSSNIFLQAQNLDSTLIRYATDFPQERIYLHYDKSSYTPAETIWFKGYMMQEIYPANESKTVYIDWTNEKGDLLLHSLSPVIDATFHGQFEVPENYDGSYLHVKVYTKWMLNFDSVFLYNKDIRILNNSPRSSAASAITPQLTFFPEGGDMIEGVLNKIAFKANDQFGRPLKITGTVKNNQGASVGDLRVIHDGMGYIFIKPKPGETFTANWQDEGGKKHTTPLPAAKHSGVSLQIVIQENKRIFSVTKSPASTLTHLNLIGTMYQQPVFKITKELKDGMAQGVIPTESLPTGILTITVFDNSGKPLAERITYINNEEYRFDPEMNVQHWGLNKRARNEVEISVPDSLSANLSVAVTDLAIDQDTSDNIISHLLLTGQLKGKINSPAYYFSNNSDSIMQQLDLVMLTHGWRRINWEKVQAGEFPVIRYPKDTSYLSISGKIYGATPSQLRQAGEIVLLINQKESGTQVSSTPVTSDGSFDNRDLILFDTARIYYQLPKVKGVKDVTVQFMQDRLPPFTNNMKASGIYYNHLSDTSGNHYHLQLSDEATRELNFLKGKVLATVNIKANPKSSVAAMDDKYASGMFKGGDGYQFDVVNDPFSVSSQNIFTYLQGKVAGLQINSTTNPPTLSWRGGTPQIYVDEMSMDADMVSSIPITDVAYIKVLRPPFMGGTGGGSAGAIAIYTRRGDDIKQEPGKGLSNNTVSGYTAIRQFYSPNYETINEENEKKDLRTTLYWNPSVVTSPGKNKIVVKFFNNDVTNAFRVIIEGITRDGRLAHLVQTME
jgi:hypothetical protein